MPKQEFNNQQKYLWSLVRQAAWDRIVPGTTHSRFAAYLLKTFSVTHANVLTPNQLRQAIATLKPYASKAAHEAKKKLRASIMSHVTRHGQDIDWLHQNMISWGFGDSLRACSHNQTLQIYSLVKKALP